MKKMIVYLIALVVLLTGCGVVDVEVESDTTYILDNITTEYENGDTYEIKSVYENELDKIVSSGLCYENDEEIGEEFYERDENGNIISITQDWDGGVIKTYEYVYDAEKRIIEKTEFIDSVFQTRTEIVYGENGKEEKVTVYDENDSIISYQEFIYDGDSKRTVNEYNADGELLRYMKHKYSYANVVVKEEVFSITDELISTTIWRYVPYTENVYYIGEFPDTENENTEN